MKSRPRRLELIGRFFSPRRLRQWVRESPAWAISIGLHLLVVLVATLVYIEHALNDDEGVIEVAVKRVTVPKIAELDRQEKGEAAAESQESAEAGLDASSGPEEIGSAEGELEGSRDDRGSGKQGTDVMGVMSGTGTRPVGRGPARRRSGARAAKDEERPRLEEPVLAALRWLARHQHPDGSWSVTAFSENCGRHGLRGDCTENAFQGNDQFEVGVTALALLAILGAGYLPSSDEAVVPASEEMNELSAALGTGRPLTWGLVARRAVKRLLKAQAPSGMVGPEVDRAIYNHLLATLALCEAYALTRTPALEEPAQRAADFTAAYRRAAQGWRYAPQAAETDSSVTGWAVLALQSARAAGLAVDRAFEDEVRRWFEAATVEAVVEPRLLGGDPSGDGSRDITGAQKQPRWLLTGYLGPADAGKLVSVPGLNDSYFYTPASTASRILVEALLTGKEGTAWPGGEKAVETLLAFPPARFSVRDRSTWRQADFYYWYHGTAALALAAGKDHPAWSRWNEALRPALLESQLLEETRGTCREGSWEPVDRWSCEGGRVYATALNALTLEAHYRYPRLPARPKPEVALRLEGR